MADLNTMSVEELAAICDERDIPLPGDAAAINKGELIRRIEQGREATEAEEREAHVSSTLRQPENLTPFERQARDAAGPPTKEAGEWTPPTPEAPLRETDASSRLGALFGGGPSKPSGTPSGTLGNATSALSTLSRADLEHLGVIVDKLRASGGI